MKFCAGCGRPSNSSQSLQEIPSLFTQPISQSPTPGQAYFPHPAYPEPFSSQSGQSAIGGEKSSAGQRISLSAAIFGVICFFLPWVEMSCAGLSRSASGAQLASEVDLPEIWFVLIAMLAASGLALFQILRKRRGDFTEKRLSVGLIGAGIFPLFIFLFEYIRFSIEISKMKQSDPFGLGRWMGSAIENAVSYQFGGIFSAICAAAVAIGGLLHLVEAKKRRGSP
jgi:hypothetical protein